MCGAATTVLAGGTETMSLVPMGGHKIAPNPTLVDTYPDVYLTTGLVAENHAREASISRDAQDAFALRSHQRAIAAIDAGRFVDEIVPLTVSANGDGTLTSEVRYDGALEWYGLTGADCKLYDERDHETVHTVLRNVLHRAPIETG